MRESGKYGQLIMSTSKVAITSEVASLNAPAVTIGRTTYASNQIATLANHFVLPDAPETPITIVVAIGTGSAIPTDISWIIDYIHGRIILSTPLTAGNTVTVSYTYASDMVEVADVTEWNFDESVKELDVTAFNDEYEVFIPLQKTWSGTVTGLLDIRMFNASQGAGDDASVNVSTLPVYFKFRKNRSSISATNPQFLGMGLVSFALKTAFSGKIEYTAKIRGIYGISKSSS